MPSSNTVANTATPVTPQANDSSTLPDVQMHLPGVRRSSERPGEHPSTDRSRLSVAAAVHADNASGSGFLKKFDVATKEGKCNAAITLSTDHELAVSVDDWSDDDREYSSCITFDRKDLPALAAALTKKLGESVDVQNLSEKLHLYTMDKVDEDLFALVTFLKTLDVPFTSTAS